MKFYRLNITPQTAIRTNQGDRILFRIPTKCDYTLEIGNRVTVVAKGRRKAFKVFVVDIDPEGPNRKVKVKAAKGKEYKVAYENIEACPGVDCKHQLSYDGKRRLKRIIRYNDYKEDLMAEVTKAGFEYPNFGAHFYFYFPMPVRWNKTKRQELHMKLMEQAPDFDNIIKAVGDATMINDNRISGAFPIKLWADSKHGWIEIFVPETLEDWYTLAKKNYELVKPRQGNIIYDGEKDMWTTHAEAQKLQEIKNQFNSIRL